VNKLAVQRQSRPLLPELSELFNGFPTFAGLRPLFDGNLIRVEDETKDGATNYAPNCPELIRSRRSRSPCETAS